jgi:hypothetical protein
MGFKKKAIKKSKDFLMQFKQMSIPFAQAHVSRSECRERMETICVRGNQSLKKNAVS